MQIPFLSQLINRILYLDLKIAFLTILTLFFLLPSPALAEKEKKENVFDNFTLYWENDTFGGTDSNYTNGIGPESQRLRPLVWRARDVGATTGLLILTLRVSLTTSTMSC